MANEGRRPAEIPSSCYCLDTLPVKNKGKEQLHLMGEHVKTTNLRVHFLGKWGNMSLVVHISCPSLTSWVLFKVCEWILFNNSVHRIKLLLIHLFAAIRG